MQKKLKSVDEFHEVFKIGKAQEKPHLYQVISRHYSFQTIWFDFVKSLLTWNE